MARSIVKEGTNFRVYDDGTVLVQNVRFSYPHLDAPWSKKETEKKKYGIVGLLPKKTHKAAADAVMAHINEILAEKNKGLKISSKDRFLRNGDDSNSPEAAGHWTINASEENAPSVRGKDTRPIERGKIKSAIKPGYWGDILIRPWWQNNEHGKKVNAGLVAVQLKKEDEIFGDAVYISEDDIDETFDAVDDDSGFDDDEI